MPPAAVDKAAFTTDGRQLFVSVAALPLPPGAFRAKVVRPLAVATPTTVTLVVVVVRAAVAGTSNRRV